LTTLNSKDLEKKTKYLIKKNPIRKKLISKPL